MDELPDRQCAKGVLLHVLADLSAGRGPGWLVILLIVALLTWATS